MDRHFSVAVDGPSGAGKSTLARAAAARFGFIYVDTGAVYRTVGLAVSRAGVASKDALGVAALLPSIELRLAYDCEGEQRMYLAGEDVSALIRAPEISIYASDISSMPEVRAFLMDTQRSMATAHSVVMDGRDIGTVVLPDADLKIFLTASPEKRAARRLLELCERGVQTSFEDVLRDINYRDENDTRRAAAPLCAARDAKLLDTSELTLNESIEALCALITECLKGRRS
ncbi:MAG: (d)CMP kinase [Oscillospiraceae bacterium]